MKKEALSLLFCLLVQVQYMADQSMSLDIPDIKLAYFYAVNGMTLQTITQVHQAVVLRLPVSLLHIAIQDKLTALTDTSQ